MNKKIVIVDDEPCIRILLEQTLEDLLDDGATIFTARDGAEGLALIKAEQPRLVFLDVMMPHINGYDVCRQVKSDPTLGDVYVILITAKGQEVDRIKGTVAGADEYITKPFDPDHILAKAKGVLGP